MKLKILLLTVSIFVVFSCKNEKKITKRDIDLTRLNDKFYIDSLEKSVANFEEFEKLFKDIDLNELLKNVEQPTKQEKIKPYEDDLVGIMNKLRDTTEYGLDKIIEAATGEKVKLSEIDFGKNATDKPRETIKNTNKTRVRKNKKIKHKDLEKGLNSLKKEYGLDEESMLVEYMRDKKFSMYNPKRAEGIKKLVANMQNADNQEITDLITAELNITKQELDLLKTMPNNAHIRTEKKALAVSKSGLPTNITNYLKRNKASEAFIKITGGYKYAARRNSKYVLNKSKVAKEKFKKLNPTWYSSQISEETYMDSRNNMIYLPLGKLSFADKVIEHKLGNPKGKSSKGSIGEPNIAGTTIGSNMPDGVICHIGTKGVLTVQFVDNVLVDVNGPDLYIFEIGAIEPTQLEISKDGENWIDIGKIEGGTASIDIHDFIKPNDSFSYVRLTDLDTQSTVPGADVDAIATIGGALRLSLDSEVLFEVGKHQLKKEGIVVLSKLADQITSLKKGMITIEGHTDDTGSSESNQTLSKKRAISVATELKKLIKNTNFKWKEVGYGESRPIVKNDSDENRQINRRVEILVMPISNL